MMFVIYDRQLMHFFVTYKRHMMRFALSLMVIGGYWCLVPMGFWVLADWRSRLPIVNYRLSITDCRLSHMDASSCCRKLEGLPVAFTGNPTPKEKLALATSGFRLAVASSSAHQYLPGIMIFTGYNFYLFLIKRINQAVLFVNTPWP